MNHRIGLIGYGVAGASFHAPIIDATDGLTLAAVVTRDPVRAQAATERYPGVEVVGEVAELWSLELDAVTIATPNHTHATLALDACEHGVSAVVDKPVATSSADAEALVAAFDEAGLLLTVYLNRRWDGDFCTVRHLVDSGSLGRVARFESRFERWRPQVASTWKETATAGQGGGILYDLGPHLIDQALTLFGPVDDVYAEVDTTRDGATNPDDVFLALHHASGVRSHLWLSAVAGDLGPRFRVLGTEGAYVVWGMDPQEAALRAGARCDVAEGWGRYDEAAWGARVAGAERVAVPTAPGNYPAFYREWALALDGTGSVPVDPADAIAGLRIIEVAAERA